MIIHTYRIKIADAISRRISRQSLENYLVEEAKNEAQRLLQRDGVCADEIRVEGDEFVVDVMDKLEPKAV